MNRQIALVLLLPAVFAAHACDSATAPRTVSLVQVFRPGDTTPANPAEPNFINRGQTMQLTARAVLSDGSQLDVTSSATWSSNNPGAMTVVAGLVTGVNPGVAIITVRLSESEGSVSFVMAPQ
jgi:hypothetical protein